jgi:AbrB family looped-hinge helix DNA binding protein
MRSATHKTEITMEATVSSKGQVTLPSELRKRLGIGRGSRIRFSLPASGSARVEPVLYQLEDLWKIADEGGPAGSVMSLEEMDAAKARRKW